MSEERGQAMVEYALLALFIGVVGWLAASYLLYGPDGNVLELYNQSITHYVSLPIP